MPSRGRRGPASRHLWKNPLAQSGTDATIPPVPIRTAVIAALSAALVLSACSAFRKRVPRAVPVRFPKAGESPDPKRDVRKVGTVLMVNAEGKFVLIETDALGTPPRGTALKTLRAGAETAVLTVGSERRGSVITADIVTGSPEPGDDVMQ